MNITIEKTRTETVEVKIPVPSFWRSQSGMIYTAILDEKTAIEFWESDLFGMNITFGTPEQLKGKITAAHNEYFIIDESEFFRMYEDAWESIRLQPKEHTTDNSRDWEAHNNLKNQL